MKLTKEERVSMWAQIVWATLSYNYKYKPVLRQLEAHMDASEKEVDELKAELSAKDSALDVDKVQMLGEVHRMMGEIADLKEKLREVDKVVWSKVDVDDIKNKDVRDVIFRAYNRLTENKVNPND